MKSHYVISLVALVMLVSCSSYRPEDYQKFVERSHLFYQQGEWSEVLDHVNEIERYALLDDQLVAMKFKALMQLNHANEALAFLNKSLALRPHSVEIKKMQAQWYFESKQYQKVIELSAGFLDHSDEEITWLLGQSYVRLENWSAAKEILEKYKGAKLSARRSHLLGQVCYKLHQYKDAAAMFSLSYQDENFRLSATQYLAWIFTEFKDVAKANRYIRELVLVNPHDSL